MITKHRHKTNLITNSIIDGRCYIPPTKNDLSDKFHWQNSASGCGLLVCFGCLKDRSVAGNRNRETWQANELLIKYKPTIPSKTRITRELTFLQTGTTTTREYYAHQFLGSLARVGFSLRLEIDSGMKVAAFQSGLRWLGLQEQGPQPTTYRKLEDMRARDPKTGVCRLRLTHSAV